MKRTLQLVLALVLAAGLLALTFSSVKDADGQRVPLDEILAHLANARPALLVLGMGFGVLHVVLRALRWRTLLAPVRQGLAFGPLFSTTVLGYVASLAPGRVGEVIRPTLLGLREKLPVSAVIASVLVERLLDLLALLTLAAVALLVPASWSGLQASGDGLAAFRTAGGVALGVGVLALFALAVAARYREGLETWARNRVEQGRRRSLRATVLRVLARFFHGAEALRRPGLVLSAGLQSLVVWTVIGAGVWFLLLGCGVEIPAIGVFVLVPALALGIAIPTPGGAGGYHLAMTKTLEGFFGIPADVGASASLLHHLANWLPMILLAMFVMAREGLGVKDLSRAARRGAGSESGEGGPA